MSNTLKNIYTDYGLTIKIENHTNWNVDFGEGIDLLNGVLTNLVVERVFVNKIPKPYSNCDIDVPNSTSFVSVSKLYDAFINSNHPYKEQYCLGKKQI